MCRIQLPENADEFYRLGLVKDGIYKRIEFAIENVFDICAILNADLALGVPGEDEDILLHLVDKGIITPSMGYPVTLITPKMAIRGCFRLRLPGTGTFQPASLTGFWGCFFKSSSSGLYMEFRRFCAGENRPVWSCLD